MKSRIIWAIGVCVLLLVGLVIAFGWGKSPRAQRAANALLQQHRDRVLAAREPGDLPDLDAALLLAKGIRPVATRARGYFMNGDTAKAIETQEKAISMLTPGESALRTQLEAALATYRQAAKNEPPDPGHASQANKGDQSDPSTDP